MKGDRTMHARVTTLTFQRGKLDEVTRILHDRAPELKQQKGFSEILALIDRATGKSTLLTLWESEADLKATETSKYYQERMAEFAPFSEGQPTREICEVVVRDISGLGGGAKFARATSVLAQPGKIEEVTRLIRESVLPAAKQQKGYSGLLSLVDHTTGKGITYGFWESEADIKASEDNGYYQAQLAKVIPISAGKPSREVYELTLPALVPAPVMQTQPHAPAP